MCTLTWGYFPDQSGYHIHFNRDESRLRATGKPPTLQQQGKSLFISPIDPQASGTWILVNEYGFSACLLNNYIDVQRIEGTRSRGLLVKDLACAISTEHALDCIEKTDIQQYSPFDIFLFDRKGVIELSWNGREQQINNTLDCFKSSSGFNADKVIQGRKKQFLESAHDPEGLRAFHASHHPEKGPYSVCMHREEAQTQSYTEIHVLAKKATMEYCDGPPCSGSFFPEARLALRRP